MTAANANAISSFLAGGGKIVKVQETILVTMQDVLAYLRSCGIDATDSKGEREVYLCNRKRISSSQVVIIANRQRRIQQLPPFAVRL